MPIYRLSGDILHSGTVRVEAETLEAAVEKAEGGQFEIDDEQNSQLGFVFDGTAFDEAGGEIVA